jgi:matrix metalloproteinase-14 (membrane-inserted)
VISLIFLAVLQARLSICAPTGSSALLYLSQFGYLGGSTRSVGNSSALQDGRVLRKAIEDFQSFAGIPVTGELDDHTLEQMQLPRCGVKDKVGTGDNRAKRYALQGSRWKVKALNYKISKYPKNLNPREVDKEIHRAFSVWSKYTDLTFTPSKGNAHIDIRFESGEHGDGDPFDGPGGTLAHAYFPVFGGDAHFDASEKWTINSYRGTNLFQVAAHEFGHSLGLSHSDVRQALMAPFYRGYDPLFELDQDDIQGIQALYGMKKNKVPSGEPDDSDFEGSNTPSHRVPAPSAPDVNLCKNPKVDTIFNSAEGYTYIFKGNKYWRLTDDSVSAGYPKLISNGWPGLPGDINAAFTYKNGKTYFFKGSKYWRYKGRKMDGEYPKEISEGFTGIPDDVDAAMVWSGNGKIYFYKGAKFWRFDPSQRPPVKSTYPKPISNWDGVPNNLDAAFKWTNGYTYFYKGDGYYRFNDRAFAVDKANPAFPRSTAYWWFGCQDAPHGTIGTSESRGWLLDEESGQDVAGSDTQDTGEHHEQTPDPDFYRQDSGSGSGSGAAKPSLVPLILTVVFVITWLNLKSN